MVRLTCPDSAQAIKIAGMEPIELLQSSQSTRQTAEILSRVLAALSDPESPPKMAAVYQDLRREFKESPELEALVSKLQSQRRMSLVRKSIANLNERKSKTQREFS